MRLIQRPRRRLRLAYAAIALLLTALAALSARALESPAASASAAEELLAHVKYLAAPERTGRGVDTPGIKLARDYIAAEFAKYGLIPGGDRQSYLQSFDVAVGVTVKPPSNLTLDQGAALKLHEDWLPLGLSTSGRVEGEAVFAGYGITAKDYGYDDYAAIDAKGKIVVVLRYEPPPKNAQSPFKKAPDFSTHAALRTKANNARDHGAIGMILVDLDHRGDGKVELMSLRSSLWRTGNGLLAAQVSRAVADQWFGAQGTSLAELKAKIDREERPASQALPGAKVAIEITLEEQRERAENIVALLPGRDPALKQEYIVIGAHYDHLGLGYFGVRDQSASGTIHHGADDNASGTAVLLQLARRLSQMEPKPARSILLAAFSAEELGLHGSRHFVNRWPQLSQVKAMINLDMVGRLRDNRVTVFGTGSAANFATIVSAGAQQLSLELRLADGVGPSDHQSFYNRKVPVLHFFTGSHSDYHRPGDTWDKLNYAGMVKIGDLVLSSALAIAALGQAPSFVSLPSRPPSAESGERRLGGVYLGVIPEYGGNDSGVLLAGVAPGSPAATAGLHQGDVIVQLAGKTIGNIEDLTDSLGAYKPGSQVAIVVRRNGQRMTLNATLGSRS